MTERDAFMQSIIENPEDDAPRLIFADRLEEWGETDYAEFIRIQIELATYGEFRCPKYRFGLPDMLFGYPTIIEDSVDHDCKWCRLKKREQELMLATKPGQWSGFPEALHFGHTKVRDYGAWTFRRGFVEQVRLSAELWLRYADELTRLQPIREVELVTRPECESRYEPENRGYWCAIRWSEQTELGALARTITTRVYHKALENQEGAWGHQDDVIRSVLEAHWPRIKFTFPPAIETFYRPGAQLTWLSADPTLVVNEFVRDDGHGRVVRANGPDDAFGVVMEMWETTCKNVPTRLPDR